MRVHPINRTSTPRVLAWLYGVPLAALLVVAVLHGTLGVSITLLFRDPIQSGKLPFHAGMASNLGIVLWAVAAVVPIFAGVLLLRAGARRRWMLPLAGGAYTAVLLADDLFVLHEGVFPVLLGVKETWVIASYGVGLLVLLWFFRGERRQIEWPLLAGALGWFAVSLCVDLQRADGHDNGWWYLAEDGAKLMGIAHWCAFFVGTSATRLRALLPTSASLPPHQASRATDGNAYAHNDIPMTPARTRE